MATTQDLCDELDDAGRVADWQDTTAILVGPSLRQSPANDPKAASCGTFAPCATCRLLCTGP
jgi:hypothetical protein